MNAQYLAMPNNYFTLVVFGGQEIKTNSRREYFMMSGTATTIYGRALDLAELAPTNRLIAGTIDRLFESTLYITGDAHVH